MQLLELDMVLFPSFKPLLIHVGMLLFRRKFDFKHSSGDVECAYHGQNTRFDTQNQINQAWHTAVASALMEGRSTHHWP